ncbi:MAG: long-chain-acyl-CoA synthetase [Rhizomicrobium sp.]
MTGAAPASLPEAGRDARAAWLRALERTSCIRSEGPTLPQLIETQARKFGAAPALMDEREMLSFGDLARRVNAYARWALAQGLGPGDVVCLFLPNSADYLALWLGITRAGATAALVNTGLRGASLAHAISIVSPKLVIVDAHFTEEITSALPQSDNGIGLWSHGGASGPFPRVDMREYGDEPVSAPTPDLMGRALLLYTSGTTGLPKAANVSHYRLMQWSQWFAGLLNTSSADRMYNCLPLYHSVGGILAVGAMLASGGSTAIRQKFSARRFWEDVRDTDCTLFAYVGELCRFLLASPPQPCESEHRLRLCCGNGLAASVWRPFQERFAIPRILEFYAATEGSVSLYNCEDEPGAIGRIPGFLRHRIEIVLVRFDFESGLPARGRDGFCISCETDEAGEALGRLDAGRIGAGAAFEGYADADATEHKILHDVFVKGDAWFRTGDLMRRDARSFFYFVDRIGETFRCNGENVSTQEVASVIAACPGVRDAVVYGVRVPDMDDKVGMAAIVPSEDFDLARLHRHLVANLPSPARPRYLRLCKTLEMTATFKPQKQKLMGEGCDPAAGDDPVYLDDKTAFVRLTPEGHGR